MSAESDPIGARLKTARQSLHYNLACLRATQDHPDAAEAIRQLQLATEDLQLRKSILETEQMLSSLRSLPGFQALVQDSRRVSSQ